MLVLCARTRIEREVAESIFELMAAPLDWDELISLAGRNSVTPLIEMSLRTVAGDSVPSEVLNRLREAVRASTARNLLLAGELIKITGLFHSQDIIAIPYKGPVIAAQAYGNVGLREFDDLDIILRQKDMAKAHEIMLSLGYRTKWPWKLSEEETSPIPGEYKYYDEARHLLVELHTQFTLRHFPTVPDLDNFARRLVPVSIAGREVVTFSVEDALPILCVHGSKDFWERISWIVDLSEMVRSHPQLDWNQALLVAESLRAERMLYLGLILASDLLGTPIPPEIESRMRKDRVATMLAQAISQRLLSAEWSGIDASARFRFRRQMLPGTLAGWRYAVRLALVPAQEDLITLRLPRPLAPLYLALRPLRLLRKYGWFGRRPQRLSS